MRKYLFSIGGLKVPGYGFMIGIGFLVALLVGEYRAKKKGLNQESVIDLAIIAILCGFLGAKLLFIIVNFAEFIESPASFISTSGFVVYGGIIAGILCCMLYCHVKKLSFMEYFDLIMPEVAIAQGFGRIGCFLAGCCYGKTTDSAWGVVFPADSLAPAGVKLIPTQLISAAGDFAIAIILIILADIVMKDINLKPEDSAVENKAADKKTSGVIACVYLWMYGLGRFLVEFLRDDVRGSVGVLSTSQFISLFIVAIGVVLYVLLLTKTRRAK